MNAQTETININNKPIITNRESAEKFRDKGLSIKQLRLLGFDDEKPSFLVLIYQ